MSDGLLLISGPLTLGTMQKVHELSQPIWIVTRAETSDSRIDGASVGKISILSVTSVIGPQSSDWFNKWTTSVRLCVPITTSTQGALFLTSSLSFCAAQPPTNNFLFELLFFHTLSWPRVPYSLSSAFSRIVHVLTNNISLSSIELAFIIPSCSNKPAILSESCSFIWQPKVLTKYFKPFLDGFILFLLLISKVVFTFKLYESFD